MSAPFLFLLWKKRSLPQQKPEKKRKYFLSFPEFPFDFQADKVLSNTEFISE